MFKKILFTILISVFSITAYSEEINPVPNNIEIDNFKFDSFTFKTTKEELISSGFQCKDHICTKNVGRSYTYKQYSIFKDKVVEVKNSTEIAFVNNTASLISSDKIIPALNQNCESIIASVKNKLEKDFNMSLYNPTISAKWREIDATALVGTTIFKNDKKLSSKINCSIIKDETTDTNFIYTKFEFYNDNSILDAVF